MATETVASDHTSTTDEFEKKVNEEAIGQKSVSLSNENGGKHDKTEDAQGLATPSSKTEGDGKKAELAVVEVEKSEDSPALEASAEDTVKHDKVEDAQVPTAPFSKTEGDAEGDEKKAEPAIVVVEKIDDSPSSEASVADANNLKEEKELIPDSQTISVTEPAPDGAKSQPEEPPPPTEPFESTETKEEKQPKTANIPEASAETVEKSSNTVEANPLIESEAEGVKETEYLEISSQKVEKPEAVVTEVQEEPEEAQEAEQPITVATPDLLAETNEKPSDATEKPEPLVTEVHEKSEEPKKESQEKPQETEQPNTVAVSEPSVETNEKSSDAIEKPEPLVTEVQEKSEEPKMESQEKPQEAEQPNTVAVSEPSIETNEKSSDAIEKPEPLVTEVHGKSEEPKKESQEKPREAEQPNKFAVSEPSAETNEKSSDAIEKPEPLVTEVHEKSEETEKEYQEREAEQPNTVAIPDPSAETNEKPSDANHVVEEKTREPEFDAEVSKETNNYKAGPTETEKAEPVVTEIEENPSEPEKQSFEKEEDQRKTVIHQAEAESAEKPREIIEVHTPQESDIEVVKETGNSKSEAVPVKAETLELESTEVEEKLGEQLEVAEEVGETSKNVESLETMQEIVRQTAKSKGTPDDTVKEPISLKEEKTQREEETSVRGNSTPVSFNEEAQAAPANLVESSPAIAEKDGKKESSCTDEIEVVSKEVVGVLKNPEQASINQEAKTDLKEERDYSPPTSVEEKVAANGEKQPGTPDAVEGSLREAQVEIKKDEAKTATTEAGDVKVGRVKDDGPAVDNEKQGHPEPDTKVDEVSEHFRETLASKLEEKKEESIRTGVDNLEKEQIEEPVKTNVQIPEPPNEESDATKTSKDLPKETPAKPAQKQSNNIISRVKQSLVRAKKAITGKSPTSKTISSEAKGDIKVK